VKSRFSLLELNSNESELKLPKRDILASVGNREGGRSENQVICHRTPRAFVVGSSRPAAFRGRI